MPDENDLPLRFHNPAKIIKQMRKRRVTTEMLQEALTYAPTQWQGKLGAARMYRSEKTGVVVLVDEVTGDIFHVGTGRFRYDDYE